MAQDETPEQTRARLKKLVPPDSNIQLNTDPTGSPLDPQDTSQGITPRPITPGKFDPQAFVASGGKSAQERAPAASPPPAATATGAQPGLMDRWNSFIDHPENRAGMMQFAVNMLSGKGFGESLGAAAEASGANVAKQEEEQKFEEQQALKERETAAYEKTAQAALVRAQRGDPQERYYNQLMARDAVAAQREGFNKYNAWAGQEDTGLDPYMAGLKKKYPGIKKEDITNESTPQGKAAAAEMRQRFLRETGGGPAPAEAPPGRPEFTPPAGAEKRYDKMGRPIYFDPKTKQPYPGQI